MPVAEVHHPELVEVAHPPVPVPLPLVVDPAGVGPLTAHALDRPVLAPAPVLDLEVAALPVGAATGPEIATTIIAAAVAGPGRQGRPVDGPAATRPAAGEDAVTAAATAAVVALPVVVGAAALVRR